jgi:hypothetical protein
METRFHYDNLAKHGVTPQEILECLATQRRQYRHKARRSVYRVIAQTSAGRYLELLYTQEPAERFVFHAMDAKPRHIRLLKRRGKRGKRR